MPKRPAEPVVNRKPVEPAEKFIEELIKIREARGWTKEAAIAEFGGVAAACHLTRSDKMRSSENTSSTMKPTDLHIERDGQRIVVSIPHTSFRLTFFRSKEGGSLEQSAAMSIDDAANKTSFEALAWDAAIHKARELGWIA